MKLKYLGIILICLGVVLLSTSSLTGNVIVEQFKVPSSNIPYLSLILIFAGILILGASSDSLQEWLGRKEEEEDEKSKKKKSPSLENLVGDHHEKDLEKRYSGKPSRLKKILGWSHVEHIPQKSVIGKEAEDYQEEYDEKKVEYLLEERKQIEKLNEKIPLLRKKLYQEKKKMDKAAESGKYMPMYENEYLQTGEELAQVYEKLKMSFPKKEYQKLENKKRKLGFQKAEEELERDIKENNVPFGDFQISRLIDMEDFQKGTDIASSKYQDRDYLIDAYFNLAKTVKISDVENKGKRVYFIHSIPSDRPGNRLHSVNNRGLMNKGDPESFRMRNFLDIITQEKPMLSASSVDDDSNERKFFCGGYGIILGNGDIYDASNEDMGSQGLESGRRLRGLKISGKDELPILERIKNAIKPSPRYKYNEFIIGNYDIKGIYFFGSEDEYYPGELNALAQESKNRNLKLYQFETGSGFKEVNPNDYLETPDKTVKKSTKKTRKKAS